MKSNEILLKDILIMLWTHQIASCHRLCHAGFTAYNTRLLQILLIALPQVKMERAREREERLKQWMEQ